jgi:beta-glucosidase
VSERALREIYLPAFQAAVEQGHAWAVMDAYNRLNGTYCSANDWLNNKVLKGEWGFPGVVMSDWGAAHDTWEWPTAASTSRCPPAEYMNPAALKPAPGVRQGQARRRSTTRCAGSCASRSRTASSTGPRRSSSIPRDDPKSAAVALQIEREAIVLLKNDANALPPATEAH